MEIGVGQLEKCYKQQRQKFVKLNNRIMNVFTFISLQNGVGRAVQFYTETDHSSRLHRTFSRIFSFNGLSIFLTILY